MGTRKILTIVVLALGLARCAFGSATTADPLRTAFTYQGRLLDVNSPADGLYDFQFKLFDSLDGSQVGSDVNVPDVEVIDGYFTVQLDFNDVFDGNERWLEIGIGAPLVDPPVSCIDDSDCELDQICEDGICVDLEVTYITLSPRQELTATPHALYARKTAMASGLVLPYAGTVAEAGPAFAVTNGGSGGLNCSAVYGEHTDTSNFGYLGGEHRGVYGYGETCGVYGYSESNSVCGYSMLGNAVYGENYGQNNIGKLGTPHYGVYGASTFGGANAAVYGESLFSGNIGTLGTGSYGVYGQSSSGHAGYFEGHVYASGDVGIGTDSPTSKLQVMSSTTPVAGWFETTKSNGNTNALEVVADACNTGDNRGLYILTLNNGDGDAYSIYSPRTGATMYHEGNVGIGTPDPAKKLQVAGDTYSEDDVYVGSDSETLSNAGFVLDGDDMFVAGQAGIEGDVHTDGSFIAGSTTTYGDGSVTSSGALNINSGALTIDSDGEVGIGTTDPRGALHVYGAALFRAADAGVHIGLSSDHVLFSYNDSAGGYANFRVYEDNTTFEQAVNMADDLTVDGQVYVPNMSSTATSYKTVMYNESTDQLYYYNLASSARYKENIRPLQDDFSKVLQAESKSFVYKANGEPGMGFIAEEFDALGLSSLVTYKDGQPDGIKYDMVPVYLLEVLKDQAQTTEQLKAENESLKQRLENLESAVKQLAKAKEIGL